MMSCNFEVWTNEVSARVVCILPSSGSKARNPEPNVWGQVNLLNAFGRPPDTATITTGSGTVDVTRLWRDEGTVTSVTSDENVIGNFRVVLDTVHSCSFVQTTVGGLHIRVRLSGPTGTANVKVKRDDGVFVSMGTVSVTPGGTVSEVYIDAVIATETFADYIDASGNVTVRVEVPGPSSEYPVFFDQVLVRSLRASETQ